MFVWQLPKALLEIFSLYLAALLFAMSVTVGISPEFGKLCTSTWLW